MKTWNLGNTTARNPERIKGALRVLADRCNGKRFDLRAQEGFFNALLEAGVITGDPAKPSSRAQSARKWAAAFNQLGLARAWGSEDVVEVTKPGLELLSDDYLDEDVFLRQMLKVQIPSPLERSRGSFSVHPLYVVLKCAAAMADAGMKGVSQEEIGLFIVTTTNDNEVDDATRRIREYRQGRDSLSGGVSKRRFFYEQRERRVREVYSEELQPRLNLLGRLLEESAEHSYLKSKPAETLLEEITTTGKGSNVRSAIEARREIRAAIIAKKSREEIEAIVSAQFLGLKGDTLNNYADTTVRYSRVTGLFTVTGDKLVIKEDQLALAKALVSEAPDFLEEENFLPFFYNPELPALPTDSQAFLTHDVARLKSMAIDLGSYNDKVKNVSTAGSVTELKAKRKLLEDEILLAKEEQFYRSQSSPEQVQDIAETFSKIANREIIGGSDYYPAWAEWAVWRSFMAINTISNPIHETRNFKIDTELYPVHHAKAGSADMVFEYGEDFIIPAETTLVMGERQYNMEGEPVQTHVLHIADANPDKKVVGVLVAPAIHPRTAQSYLNANEWSERRKDTVRLNIVPLTVAQLVSLLPGNANGCTSASELIVILNKLLGLRNECSNGLEWLDRIEATLSHTR